MATVAPATPSTSTEPIGRNHRRWQFRRRGTSSLKKGGTAQSFRELQPAMALPSSRRSNLEERRRSVLWQGHREGNGRSS